MWTVSIEQAEKDCKAQTSTDWSWWMFSDLYTSVKMVWNKREGREREIMCVLRVWMGEGFSSVFTGEACMFRQTHTHKAHRWCQSDYISTQGSVCVCVCVCVCVLVQRVCLISVPAGSDKFSASGNSVKFHEQGSSLLQLTFSELCVVVWLRGSLDLDKMYLLVFAMTLLLLEMLKLHLGVRRGH